jgi:LysM repeat protein
MPTLVNGQVTYSGGEALPPVGSPEYQAASSGNLQGALGGAGGSPGNSGNYANNSNSSSNTNVNIPTPTPPANSNVANTTTNTQPSTYQIQSGQTLTGIAQELGTNIQELMRLNPNIQNPNVIQSGGSLNVPGSQPAGTPSQTTANQYQNSVLSAVNSVPDQNDQSAVYAAAAAVPDPGDSGLPPNLQQAVTDATTNYIEATTAHAQQAPQNFISDYQNFANQLGVPALQAESINLQNVMNGTPADIEAEVTKAGGFMSQSQVYALSATRNKAIINQANLVQAQLQNAESTLSTETSLDQANYSAAEQQYNDTTGADTTLIGLGQSAQSIATKNYTEIYNKSGPNGLAEMAEGNPTLQSYIEQAMGFSPGTLTVGSPQLTQADATFLPYQTQANANITAQAAVERANAMNVRAQVQTVQGAQEIASSYEQSPAYQSMLKAGPDLSVISTAASNPSSVTDGDLTAAVNGLVQSASGLPEADISNITGGESLTDYAEKLAQGALGKGGQLSSSQRSELVSFGQKIASALGNQVTDNYNSTLSNFGSTPFNFTQTGYYTPTQLQQGVADAGGSSSSNNSSSGVTIGNTTYSPTGTNSMTLSGGQTMTLGSNGQWSDGDGNYYTYDESSQSFTPVTSQ